MNDNIPKWFRDLYEIGFKADNLYPLCKCGLEIHPGVPCEEFLCDACGQPGHKNNTCLDKMRSQTNEEKKDTDEFLSNYFKPFNNQTEQPTLPLITNRHYNKAVNMLGKVHRVNLIPGKEYPEIGCVEVNNAIGVVANLLAEVEFLKKKI